ncbi:hypothetical protein DIS24_g5635 [Lasiodiplodia hormozganensis]|uniref:SnoaL-like domain-containing protein n=1 Tax=Lasiodiplodia hormozganensis TaxID=869390 RepID=A0AA39YJS7_9PEZI|nr:hypothetical protein DIS24_g5635 [Lasiodiplodia hormozganensis]
MRYQDYIDAFNHNADQDAKAQFFTEDATLEAPYLPTGILHGRTAIMAMFAAAHAKVKEELRPRLVVQQGDDVIMAEVDACFVANEDTHESGFYDFKKGEAVSFRFFGVYELRDGRISKMRLSYWPNPSRIEAF